ncbi:MAG: 16S rRNA (cytosine(1402)-N(4))-methyltransferase RsmH [Candidatus Eremiobacteraeota bacterium]|nr:16S rRNA (cytosine(1402)-N(4))-methyltransferase RsmH [Candidatus Eremiobacteraeota bacterium]
MHVPVLLKAAVEALHPLPGGIYVDATFGGGGHAGAIAAHLELQGTRPGRLLAIDVDPTVASDLPGVELVRGNFADLESILDACGIEHVDGVLFDFGPSSAQFDRPERGFSFRADGPLDMRMDQSRGRTAAQLLEHSSESELSLLFSRYGEERVARRIARAIVAAREGGRAPRRTLELARLVAGVVHVQGRRERIHPATRVFQALRIAVNDELEAIRRGLTAAAARTRPGARIVAITFHSLEDRIVKHRFRDDERLHVITRRPIVPDAAEIARNPRARSAKLRVAERSL